MAAAHDRLENPLDDFLGYQLRRASAAGLVDLGRSLAELGLKPTEASVLMLVAANPGVTQSEVGRVLGIKRANMAPIAAMLTARGVVERSRADGRSQGLRLSDTGIAFARDVRARVDAHETRLIAPLSEAEGAMLVALVRRLWSGRDRIA